jgi:type VI protein secretion system component VasK
MEFAGIAIGIVFWTLVLFLVLIVGIKLFALFLMGGDSYIGKKDIDKILLISFVIACVIVSIHFSKWRNVLKESPATQPSTQPTEKP